MPDELELPIAIPGSGMPENQEEISSTNSHQARVDCIFYRNSNFGLRSDSQTYTSLAIRSFSPNPVEGESPAINIGVDLIYNLMSQPRITTLDVIIQVKEDGVFRQVGTMRQILESAVNRLEILEGEGNFSMCGAASDTLMLNQLGIYSQNYWKEKVNQAFIEAAVVLADHPEEFNAVFLDFFPDDRD